MKKIQLITLTGFIVLATACASTGDAPEAEAPPAATPEQIALYQQSLEAAKAAHGKAMEVGYAWTTTDELIEKAEESAGKGDVVKAQKMLETAKHHAELAVQQYEQQKKSAPRY